MRVLIINKFLHPNGGSETYIFKLGEAMEQHGHEVQYFSLIPLAAIMGTLVLNSAAGSKIAATTYTTTSTAIGSKSMTAKSQNWKQNGKTYRLLQTLIRFWMCTVSIENWKKSPVRWSWN